MRKIVRRVQSLGEKAEQFKQAIQSVPPRIAEIRESVAMTTTQLQQLRANVQSSVADLRVEDSDRVIDALDEINGAAAVFMQAGYELSGVDMELSPAQRLIVHLDKAGDVPHGTIRALINANQKNRTVHALLSALLQAEGTVDKVTLTNLDYRTLVVHLGPVPIVRLCWRAEEILEFAESAGDKGSSTTTTSSAPSGAMLSSGFGQSSFFERRGAPEALEAAVIPAMPAPMTPGAEVAATTGTVIPGQPAAAADWKRESLDRFKKMPAVSKYKR